MNAFDVILVLPYPFADHPSFPEGILKRALENDGFSVGIIECPFWQNPDSFKALGRPRLCFAVVPGPVDSVVLNYTALRKRRREDLYQVRNEAFFPGHPPSIKFKKRPDRTVIVFAQRIRQVYRDTPIIIGGMEATMRRFAHYDFQEDAIRRSVLFDSKADILVFGRGEQQLVQIARELRAGQSIENINTPGIAKKVKIITATDGVELPSHEEIKNNPQKLLTATLAVEKAMIQQKMIFQRHGDQYLCQWPTATYANIDLDRVYGYPFSRSLGGSPELSAALKMNLFSVTSHWGCLGNCSFCSLCQHMGRKVLSRSQESILKEISGLTRHPRWNGHISDIGGASAEMYGLDFPPPTGTRTHEYLDLLRQARKIPGIQKIFIGSGIRYDFILKFPELLEEIMTHHCGQFLRVAPEHSEAEVLRRMGKPAFPVFQKFCRLFSEINRGLKRKIKLVPYLMVGHPGECPDDIDKLIGSMKSEGIARWDAQVFTPTPGTRSTAMYVSGLDEKERPVIVEKRISNLSGRFNKMVEGYIPTDVTFML